MKYEYNRIAMGRWSMRWSLQWLVWYSMRRPIRLTRRTIRWCRCLWCGVVCLVFDTVFFCLMWFSFWYDNYWFGDGNTVVGLVFDTEADNTVVPMPLMRCFVSGVPDSFLLFGMIFFLIRQLLIRWWIRSQILHAGFSGRCLWCDVFFLINTFTDTVSNINY